MRERGWYVRCQGCGAILPPEHATKPATEDYCPSCKSKSPYPR